MPRFDALANIAIEQLDAFEQLSRDPSHDVLDLLAANGVGNEQREIELRGGRGRQRLVAARRSARARTGGRCAIRPAAQRAPNR